MTEQELRELAKEQVRQLATIMRLQNWEFTVIVVSALELTLSSAWAELWSNTDDYTAIIKLNQARWLYKVEWNDKEIKALRQTIAHELVHLYHHIGRKFADKDYREEWMCEMIADSIIRAKELEFDDTTENSNS